MRPTKVDFDPFAGPKIVRVIPATEPQLEVWLSCVIGGKDANRAYNESVSLLLEGNLNDEALAYALEEVCNRHELLRSTVSPDGRNFCIYERLPLSLKFIDISQLDESEHEGQIKELNYKDAHTEFNLEKGPLFRSYLVKLANNKHLLKLSAHHIICDGWSFGILLENISSLYSALIVGEAARLDKAIPFSEYASETSRYLMSDDYKATERYWLDQYRTNVPVLDLPTDESRPLQRTFKSSRLDFPIESQLIDSAQKMGSKSGASLVTTLITAFEVYLHLLTGQTDIVIGVPAAGQAATGKHELIGHCVNMLPLRSKIENEKPFSEHLKKRKSKILDDYDHQQFTFGSLLKKLNIPRDSSRVPLIPVVFNIDMGMDSKVSFSGLQHSLSSDPRAFENFELFLNLTGTSKALIFEWSYNSHLFNAPTIKRMMDDFQSVLEQLIQNPKTKIKDIAFNATNHLEQVHIWNNSTKTDYPKDKTVIEFIDEIAVQHPSKTAVYFRDEELTYSALIQKANQLANYLVKSGVKKGSVVGIAIDRSFEMIISLLAVMKVGAAYLPLDPQYPKARLKFMIEDSAATHLIVSEEYGCLTSDTAKVLVWEMISEEIGSFCSNAPTETITGTDLAYILYTSGSTGKPKGVQIEHHSLTNFLLSVQKEPGINFNDIFLAITTISFDIAGTELYLPLITGASIHLVDSSSAKDGRELLRLVQGGGISIMQATPTTWRMMLSAGWDKKYDLKIICTGEAFPKDLTERLLTRGSEVWNGYGPTETTIWSSIKQIKETTDTITIGRPIANTQFYILDEQLRSCPAGTPGEIYIAGEGLARGYLNRADLTSVKFISNPYSTAFDSKMYATGDLGYFREDGEVVCQGRIDSQIKIRGYRIEVGEIEYYLTQQPGVKSTVVVSKELNDSQHIVAYIVPDENVQVCNDVVSLVDVSELQIKSWRSALEEVLPNFMIPNIFLGINYLPITDNFKVDRRNLPFPDRNDLIDTRIDPRNKHEKQIHDIWAKALSIELISVTSNFFELGGHSLVAVRTMLDLERKTGLKLPMSLLFEASTIEQLANKIAAMSEKEETSKLALKRSAGHEYETKAVPTIPPQTEIWAACILGGDDANRSYNLSFSERLFGDLNENALKRSLQELLNRHESLRSSFNHDGSEMLIKSYLDFDYVFEDLSSLSPGMREEALLASLKDNTSKVFDLFNGPLIKASVIRLNEQEHILSIVVHHIVCDGFSSSILMSELSELYSLFAQNKIPTLQPAAKYSDFVLKKNEFYKTKDYANVEQYWVDKFKAEAPILNIPTDFVRPDKRTYAGSRVFYEIDSTIGNKFKALGFSYNCSASIALRAAFEVFLSALCKQNNIVLGLPFAGQFAEENTNLVGHCVNLLPIIAKIDSRLTFSEYLTERKTELLDAYKFNDITFSSLLNKLDIYRENSRVPLAPVFLNVHSDPEEYSFYKLSNQRINSEKKFETFEISINIDDIRSGMTVRWDFNTNLFREETIQNFHTLFEKLLARIGNNPNATIYTLASALDIDLNGNSAVQESVNWNETALNYDKNVTIFNLISERSRDYAHKTAISFGETEISYEELEKRSNRFANYLIEEGVQKGDIVGILMDRSIEMVVALIATMKSGAAYLPLDPLYPEERIEYMLSDSSAKFVITSEEKRSTSTKSLVFSLTPNRIQLSDECPNISITGNDLAYILYTSGSTGNPKGVQIENHSFLNFLLSMQRQPGINDQDILLAATTISFDIAGLELFLPLISGAQVVLASSNTARDGGALLKLIEEKKITILQATPITWTMLLECGWNRTQRLKVLCGGEALPKKLAERLVGMGNEVWNMYGPTETTIWSSIKRISNLSEPITIGYPIANTQIYILDDSLNQAPVGSSGEIYISGEGLARGYLNRTELTSERFLPNPFLKSASRMYKTGDIGYFLENGEIVCLGRTDDQVKINGFRIELGEIEYLLSNQPDVKEAIVTIHEVQPNQQTLLAYVVLNKNFIRANDDLKPAETRVNYPPQHIVSNCTKALRRRLPEYMIPSHYFSVDRFPTTKNGKIDRKSLPVVDINGYYQSEFDSVEPRNEMEKLVAQAWSVQLNIKVLSVKDNFFELGGNSLMAIRLMLQLEKETGTKLPISTLFDSPTIEELAKMFTGEKTRTKWDSLVPIKTNGTKTPLYLIHGGGYNILTFEPLSKHMDPDQPIYALQGLGLYDKSKLFSSIEEIAGFYVSEMLENDPVGPYSLGGYSSGGILAFEMARQLIEKGKQVISLVMLDTSYEENYSDTRPLSKLAKLVVRQMKKTLFYAKSLIKHPEKTARYLKRRVESEIHSPLRHISIQYEDEINESYANAFRRYRMKPLPIKVDLFRVKTRVYYIDEPVHYGWIRHAEKGVEVHEVEGEHNTFLLPPYEKEFARIFQNVIDANYCQ